MSDANVEASVSRSIAGRAACGDRDSVNAMTTMPANTARTRIVRRRTMIDLLTIQCLDQRTRLVSARPIFVLPTEAHRQLVLVARARPIAGKIRQLAQLFVDPPAQPVARDARQRHAQLALGRRAVAERDERRAVG